MFTKIIVSNKKDKSDQWIKAMLYKSIFLQVLKLLFFMFEIFLGHSSYTIAADRRQSESDLCFFTTQEKIIKTLHDACYTQEEIVFLEQYFSKHLAPKSLEKDDAIAKNLAQQIKTAHENLLKEDTAEFCCYIPMSSFPENISLEAIVKHCLSGSSGCFGPNRTFRVLQEKLKWINSYETTSTCPHVFKIYWEKGLLQLGFSQQV